MAKKALVTISIPDEECERLAKFAWDNKTTAKKMTKDAFKRIPFAMSCAMEESRYPPLILRCERSSPRRT